MHATHKVMYRNKEQYVRYLSTFSPTAIPYNCIENSNQGNFVKYDHLKSPHTVYGLFDQRTILYLTSQK